MSTLDKWLDDWAAKGKKVENSYANGGLVTGAGSGTSDSIPIESREPGGAEVAYSAGEYVIPADVVNALGRGTFDKILEAFHTPVNGGTK